MKHRIQKFVNVLLATALTVGAIAPIKPTQAFVFESQEVDQSKFVAVASPFANGRSHQLLIIEQVSNARPCWSERGASPILVDPLLTTFDFSGICGRSTDSNGYSIRVNNQDLALQYSLRIVNRNGDLQLIGAPRDRNQAEVVIARAFGTTNQFARLTLMPGWRFARRVSEGRPLGHIYLAYDGPFPPPDPGTVTEPPAPPPFGDVAFDIYRQEISRAVVLGFIAGFYEDNTFRPQNPLTREQLVSMVISALGSVPDINVTVPTQATGSPYPDVAADRWSAAKIQFASANNIVTGYQDGTFKPQQNVTRAEMMAVLRRTAEYARRLQGKPIELPATQQPRAFSDTATHWSNTLVTQMSSYCGVASPLNEQGDRFAPNDAALRNYAAAATLRTVDCLRAATPPAAGATTPTRPRATPAPATPATPAPATPAPATPTTPPVQ